MKTCFKACRYLLDKLLMTLVKNFTELNQFLMVFPDSIRGLHYLFAQFGLAYLILFSTDLFRIANGWEGAKSPPPLTYLKFIMCIPG